MHLLLVGTKRNGETIRVKPRALKNKQKLLAQEMKLTGRTIVPILPYWVMMIKNRSANSMTRKSV
jgi:hypothetical protein